MPLESNGEGYSTGYREDKLSALARLQLIWGMKYPAGNLHHLTEMGLSSMNLN